MALIIPAEVVDIRRELCAACPAEDPCASCEHGQWGQYEASKCSGSVESQGYRIGDMVAAIATPIARVLGLPCIDPATKQLRPESGCAKRKAKLNQLGARD